MDLSCNLSDVQKSVLGCILIDTDLIPEVLLRVAPVDFADQTLRLVYATIRDMYNSGDVLDPVTVHHRCGAGYFDVIASCIAETPTTANFARYVDILLEQSKLKRLTALIDPIAYSPTLEDARKYIDEANALLCDRPDVDALSMEQGLIRFMERQTGKSKPEYLRWGFEPMDKKLYIQAGDFVVVGGDPSTGKTAFTIQLAMLHSKTKRVGYFSLETSNDKVYDRLMANAMQVQLSRIKKTELDDGELCHAAEVVAKLAENTLDVISAAGWTVAEIQTYARSRRYDIIYVDYLQLVSASGRSRTEQVTNISIGLHTIAQENKITVFALSQLSRGEKGAIAAS